MTLDEAWAEAEAVLPKRPGGGVWDSSGGVGLEVARWTAGEYVAQWGDVSTRADTPAAALHALAVALRSQAARKAVAG